MTPATAKRGSSIIEAEAEAKPAQRPNRRNLDKTGPSKQTLIIARKTHTRLVDYGKDQDVSLQDIFTEAMNEWLVKRGMPAMYDAEGKEL